MSELVDVYQNQMLKFQMEIQQTGKLIICFYHNEIPKTAEFKFLNNFCITKLAVVRSQTNKRKRN